MTDFLSFLLYLTGRNETYRNSNKAYEEWNCNHSYALSDQGSDTDYENQALKDDKDSGAYS